MDKEQFKNELNKLEEQVKSKDNIQSLKDLIGENLFNKLPNTFTVYTDISNSWDGAHFFEVNKITGKVTRECSVAFVENVYDINKDGTFLQPT